MTRCPGIVLLASLVLSLSCLPAAAATAFIVSGQVTAPGGVIASHGQSEDSSLARVLDFLVPSAQAEMAGLLPVPNGTPVELVKINNGGGTSAPIARTTTQYGRYRFNLSALRRTVSSRLIVRVGNVATGAQMRAFVSDKTVDIDPASEAAVRMVLDRIASTPNATLDNFTVVELEDLAGSLELLTSAGAVQAAADIESSVLAIRDAVAGNAGIRAFLTASVRSGQTKTGPGDIGNFFPFTKGISWTYRVQRTEDGITSAPYTNTVLINGTRVINGVTTTVFRNSNSDGDGVADNDFNKKTSSGVYDWEPVRDGDSNKPHQFVRFPAAPGSSFKQTLSDMGFNRDLDRDGIRERFTFTITTTVVGLGRVSVPAGNLPNTLKIRTTLTGGATVSSTRKRIALTVTAIEWYTQNLGLSKQTLSSRMTYDGEVWKDSQIMELTEANGFPLTGEFPLNRWTTLHIDSTDIVYDHVRGRLFASVPSHATSYADNIIVVDPALARVEAAIPVGNNPGPLAVSDDGQFLYVGLNGANGSVLQVSIPTLAIGPEWILSSVPDTTVIRYPYDIAVQPGNPQAIAVTTGRYPLYRGNSDFAGTVMLDSGVERPTAITLLTGWFGPDTLMFTDDPSIAYGYARAPSDYLYDLSVTEGGISVSERREDFDQYGTDFKYQDGKIYTSSGNVIDTATWNVLGRYSSSYWGGRSRKISPNAQIHRAALFISDYNRSYLELFGLDTYLKLDELILPTGRDDSPTHIESIGSNGFAIRMVDTSTNTLSTPDRARLILIKPASGN